MFCENCGKELPDGVAFCTSCGAKQTGVSTVAQPVLNAQPTPVQVAEKPVLPRQQPAQTSGGNVDVITMGQYLIMFLITAIPIAGIVMLFIWSFGAEAGPNKKNFARAYLIMMAIAIGASILISIIMSVVMASLIGSMYYY